MEKSCTRSRGSPAVVTGKAFTKSSIRNYVVPLIEKFHKTYGHYPKYPVADAGYGPYNNYLYIARTGICRNWRSLIKDLLYSPFPPAQCSSRISFTVSLTTSLFSKNTLLLSMIPSSSLRSSTRVPSLAISLMLRSTVVSFMLL